MGLWKRALINSSILGTSNDKRRRCHWQFKYQLIGIVNDRIVVTMVMKYIQFKMVIFAQANQFLAELVVNWC